MVVDKSCLYEESEGVRVAASKAKGAKVVKRRRHHEALDFDKSGFGFNGGVR